MKESNASYSQYSQVTKNLPTNDVIKQLPFLFSLTITCPFLNMSGYCDIYAVRPLTCRFHGWSVKCNYMNYAPAPYNKYEQYPEYKHCELDLPMISKPYPIIDFMGDVAPMLLINKEYFKEKYT